ncbi:MAG TPA: NUDIX hydrolase [Mycobacteriales bacterium]|nr:NUDIX hydrolase [Mycobacteriales bacterium]
MTPSALDGDGWVTCSAGHQHWGRHGAAGMLLRTTDPAGVVSVLLQRRAWWTHHGGTWGLPGGARASWETPQEAAFRELGEEVSLSLEMPEVDRIHQDDHGGWAYWTVIASIDRPLPADPRGHETAEIRWVEVEKVNLLELHPGFAQTWPLVAP